MPETRFDDGRLRRVEQRQFEHQAGDAGLDVGTHEGQRAGHADREVDSWLAADADLVGVGVAGEIQRRQHARAIVG